MKSNYYCKEVLHSYLSVKLNLSSNLEELMKVADARNIDYHNFKNSELPRVEKVLGMLKGIRPPSILDIGFGRGKFLFPYLEEFGNTNITALEQNTKAIQDVRFLQHSYNKLSIIETDFFKNQFTDKFFHTITALEVMEHIEDTEKFLDECVRLAYDWIILSVPSKEDDNPQHIHLFDEAKVNQLFNKYNLTPKYEYVLNHMIIKVKI